MKLNSYIQQHCDEIIEYWEQDMKRFRLHSGLPRQQLRNHIESLLLAIDKDMQESEKLDESRPYRGTQTAAVADIHGLQREEIGAEVVHLSREFHSLRHLVLSLWKSRSRQPQQGDIDDVLIFNELMDSALTQSIESYARAVRHQSRLYKTMLSSLPNPCFILDLEGCFVYANPMMAELCNLDLREMKGKKFSQTRLPAHYNGHEQLEEVIQDRTHRRGEVEIQIPSGETRCFEYLFVPVMNEDGEPEAVAGIAHDVTERKDSEAEIWHHANYDQLTDIPNRRLFQDRLQQHAAHSARTGSPLALFFIDLDHFKVINDELGHESGDQLLREVAERIQQCLRHSDTVARIGGDEFTVILLDTDDPALIRHIASNILTELDRPFSLDHREVTISASIGITLLPHDASSAEQLLRNADQAMYLAKIDGRNRLCFFSETQQQERLARRALTNDLRKAIERDQLQLYYQPIVDLSSGRIAKAEALVRWAHPTKGLLMPGEFLTLAEESGQMAELENWVFAEAARYLGHWGTLTDVENEAPFQLSLNASPMQFMLDDHTRPWQPHLGRFADSGNNVIVELTENIFLQDSESLEERFSELRHANMELALDDFGTGYSSLAYLKRFDVHYLKIDRSFIHNHTHDSNSKIIAETMIFMAHKLGLEVVAEGVETAEQLDWLVSSGCDFAQGYFLSRPLPHDEFSALLTSGAALGGNRGAISTRRAT